ncbi:hypothetical protein RFI_16572 [Reticulomyxa filosa]|uniref:Kelch motif family protein n=1 Tax=Reticulomyxa filosa TaxID=46433 RepID=X6N5Q9_RETFI|nr:hypothetical protein RFI_16572 [Reticulomyxa filosa]|eukprot:ETO20647.1 hypothetical protein RFI_16572 [Reticulomyxa filosa]
MESNYIKLEETSNLTTTSPFEILASLPIPLRGAQCVPHSNEIIICGGSFHNDCYSYHILRNQYKFICSYPKNISLYGHCVVKYANNHKNSNVNEITLLSFGGTNKHTLTMKYVSVWDEEKENRNGVVDTKHINEWAPLIDSKNKQVYIGGEKGLSEGLRAVIGGNNNHLLFITHLSKSIEIFDLGILQHIRHAILPIENVIMYHCFVLKPENKLQTANENNDNKKITEMMLFCERTGLSIKYNEATNTFQFNNIRVCTTLRFFSSYGYVCVNDFILFFGGDNVYELGFSNEIYKYLTVENKWIKFEQTLPMPLADSLVVASEDNVHIHIIGGCNGDKVESAHMKIKVKELINEETEEEKRWIKEENEQIIAEEIQLEIKKMDEGFDIKKLKVDRFLFTCYLF